jgi:hypothetical protein
VAGVSELVAMDAKSPNTESGRDVRHECMSVRRTKW